MKTILCIGTEWRGSNATGLFYSFTRLGKYLTHIIDVRKFVSLAPENLGNQILGRLIRTFQIDNYNNHIKRIVQKVNADLIFVYKGQYIKPDTFEWIRKFYNVPIVLFYPDISFKQQGPFIYSNLVFYDVIYSTKSFAKLELDEAKIKAHFKFIPHGFDPSLHRVLSQPVPSNFKADLSFTGSYSDKKDNVVKELSQNIDCSNLSYGFKVWGGGWLKSKSISYHDVKIQGFATAGDTFVASINGTRINLAILYEGKPGVKSQDKITSRTFHIPGSGGFMIHERTDELNYYFEDDKEVVTYAENEELADKTRFYLKNEAERKRIKNNGYSRALKCHSLDMRAKEILRDLKINDIFY